MILTLLSLLLIATFILGYKCANNVSGGQEQSPDTLVVNDTIWKDTTIFKDKLVPKYIKVVKRDTITKDTILTVEQKIYEDTLCNDKDSIILQSFISGINSSLDSVKVRLKKQEITNTIEITKYIKEKEKLLKIQPQLGIGYGLFNKQPDMYIGIGISVNL